MVCILSLQLYEDCATIKITILIIASGLCSYFRWSFTGQMV